MRLVKDGDTEDYRWLLSISHSYVAEAEYDLWLTPSAIYGQPFDDPVDNLLAIGLAVSVF